MSVLFVIGGARSGKSHHAPARMEALPGRLAFIATAQPYDAEMEERIARHQADRGPRWTTLEAPIDLPDAIAHASRSTDGVLVDCLTLWLSNLMAAGRDPESEVETLARGLDGLGGPVVFVSNEVGLGVIPANALARSFADAAGLANQRLAARADRVVFTAAGLPLVLKGRPL